MVLNTTSLRICTEHIIDPYNTIHYIGAPFHVVNESDASFMFGDIFLVVNSNFMPAGKF